MDSHDLSHISALLQALSERIKDLNYEFEMLYVKVELTLDLWHKIRHAAQKEIEGTYESVHVAEHPDKTTPLK